MTYATENGVKYRCKIATTDETYDTEIAKCMTYGDAFVDGYLTANGVATGGSDQILIEAAEDFAAFMFLRARNSEQAADYKDTAKLLMQLYCAGNAHYTEASQGPPYRAGYLSW
jgi:hypothetical protein